MITVVTATLPERARLFAEMADSLARQTLPPSRWLVEWDYEKRGPVDVINGLAAQVETPWLFPFADDDLLEHDHFDTLKPYLTDDADIVYSWCRIEGVRVHGKAFQCDFDGPRLERENFIPAAACIRTELFAELGGYQKSAWTQHEDWDLWVRAYRAGARFRCVPVITWTYRMNEQWAHRSI